MMSETGFVELGSRGPLELTGADRLTHLHNFTTQQITGLAPGQGTWAAVVNVKGRVLDHVQVLVLSDRALVLTSPGRAEALASWFGRYAINADVQVRDVSGETCLLALVGPRRRAMLDALGFGAVEKHGFTTARVEGHAVIAACNLLGYRLLVDKAGEQALRQALWEQGARELLAADLEALRIREGIPAYGAEISEDTNPWEPRLDAAICLHKGCYLGQEVVARLQAYDKIQRRLMGVALSALPAGLPCELFAEAGGDRPAGVLTSAIEDEGRVHGLALVRVEQARPGVVLRCGEVSALLEDRPFWTEAS